MKNERLHCNKVYWFHQNQNTTEDGRCYAQSCVIRPCLEKLKQMLRESDRDGNKYEYRNTLGDSISNADMDSVARFADLIRIVRRTSNTIVHTQSLIEHEPYTRPEFTVL